MTGERKNVSVVYSLIFLVYSSSIGWLGSRPGLAVAGSWSVSAFDDFGLGCCAAAGTARSATISSGRTRFTGVMGRHCKTRRIRRGAKDSKELSAALGLRAALVAHEALRAGRLRHVFREEVEQPRHARDGSERFLRVALPVGRVVAVIAADPERDVVDRHREPAILGRAGRPLRHLLLQPVLRQP